MNTLNEHYRELLGLTSDWAVQDVTLSPDLKRVDIVVSFTGEKVPCPDCNKLCAISDHAPERKWRHLDTMQFETFIISRTPRCNCSDCGVKTIKVPWAYKHSRFTLLFECFAIKVIESCSTIKSAQQLCGLSWDTIHTIMKRAVERGLVRRDIEELKHVGIDEKQFRRGQDYISMINDLDNGRVLDVADGRTFEASKALLKQVPEAQRKTIEAVAVDLWSPFLKAIREVLPNAAIVHDKFHISGYLNKAVDSVRKNENKTFIKDGNDALVGSKYLWLKNPDNMNEEVWATFEELKDKSNKTARAWAIKENFKYFWNYTYPKCAEDFFNCWYGWAIRSRLNPVKKVAKRLKKHLKQILTYMKHRITNAVSEGLNSRIQTIKSAARGFHSFDNFRIRILFFCGKLDMAPNVSH